jgi:hypothetical protein
MDRLLPSDAMLLLRWIAAEGEVRLSESFREQQKKYGLNRPDFVELAVEKGDIFETSTGNYLDSLLPAYKLEALVRLEGVKRWVSIEFYFHGTYTACLFGCRVEEVPS